MSKIGFIGLGVMGSHMASHLLDGGHELFLFSRSGIPEDIHGRDAVMSCANSAEVADLAEIVIIMVPDTPDVEDVLFSTDGVMSAISGGKLVIDMSSISPIATRVFAARLEEADCDYLDAPVSGGEVGARAGTLTIMVGGGVAAFQRALPLFELMGKNINLIGDHGAGQICKAANQMIVAMNLVGVSEALTFAARAGVNAEKVRQALVGGFASSRVLEVHGERMTRRTFEPGFRVDLHRKDLAIALDSASSLGLALPQTAYAAQLMAATKALGLGDKDHSAVVRAVETLAQCTVGD